MNIETNNTRDDDWFDAVGKYERHEAPAQQEQNKIGCVQHDCEECRKRFLDGIAYQQVEATILKSHIVQEPDYWLGYGLQAYSEKPFEGATALYTRPAPAREPLSEDEIARVIKKTFPVITAVTNVDLKFARAIEQAHGIGS